jgi:NADH dehydrogenase
MSIRSVLVVGGSGFVGRHLVHRLAAQAIRVLVPTRRRERAKALILLPTVEVLEGDVHDPQALARLVAKVDAVVNLVGILHGDFQRVHVELTRKILDACRQAGVPRYVHMSALCAAPDAPSAYLRSKGEAEMLVRAADCDALRTTIFRPSVVFGRDDRFLNLFADIARIAPVMAVASPDARFQPVHVEDVGHALAGCLADPRTFGRSYDLCGPKVYTLRELVAYVCKTAGLRRPVIGLGASLSKLQAFMLEWVPGKPMTRDNLLSMRVDNVCQCPFPEVFGFTPTPMEAVVPTYIAGVTPRSRYRWFRFRARR